MSFDFMLGLPLLGHDAVTASVAEINHQSKNHPNDEPVPVFYRQREHQQQAGQNTQNRSQRYKWRPKRPVRIGVRPSHHDDGAAYDNEGEQRSDAGHFGKDAERNESRHGAHKQPSQNSRFPRRSEPWMDVAEKALWHQSITRKREHDTWLTEHHYQQYGGDSNHCTRG